MATTLKYKKEYLIFNIPLIIIFLALFISPFFIRDRWVIYYCGIAARFILGIWCIFNGIWNSFTDYYSILKNNKYYKDKKTPKLAWLLLLVVGLVCIITAFMGYGFNNVSRPN